MINKLTKDSNDIIKKLSIENNNLKKQISKLFKKIEELTEKLNR